MLRLISLYLVGILKDYPDKFTDIFHTNLLSTFTFVTCIAFYYISLSIFINQICKSIVYTIYGQRLILLYLNSSIIAT